MDDLQDFLNHRAAGKEWHVDRYEASGSRPHILKERPIWEDNEGTLAISRVDVEDAPFFRIFFEKDLCIDLLPGNRFGLTAPPSVPRTVVRHLIADQAIPRALAHSGILVLHAGSVSIEASAVLLVGPSGCGKSTLTASFHQAGHQLLGDDAVMVTPCGTEFFGEAVYPSLRLLPDAIRSLLPDNIATTAISGYSSKRRIDFPVNSSSPGRKLPIGAIFRLERESGADRIDVRSLSIAETCMTLVENSFMLDPTDLSRAGEKLLLASQIAGRVPAFALTYPRDFNRLTEVREFIRQKLSS